MDDTSRRDRDSVDGRIERAKDAALGPHDSHPSRADELAEAAGSISGVLVGAGIGSAAGPLGTLIGGIAGAIGGNVAQNRFFDKPQPAQQVFVRLQSGVLIVITQAVNPALNRGMRVYVEGFGNEARVLPA